MKEITIVTNKGQLTVEAHIVGSFGIHRPTYTSIKQGWEITHLATGCSVTRHPAPSLHEARAFARELEGAFDWASIKTRTGARRKVPRSLVQRLDTIFS